MPSAAPGTLYLLTRPSMFLLHVPAAIAVVTAVLLGQWQVNAWQMHRENQALELTDSDPVPLSQAMGPDEPFPGEYVGQPVHVSGEWLPESTVYVAGKSHDGADGYWMVTQMSTCGSDPRCPEPAAMPIVLGWSHEVAQAPSPPQGSETVTGWLQPGEGAGEPDPDLTDEVMPTLRIATLLQRADRDLYGAYVILDSPAELRQGLAAVTPESLPDPPTFTALRNLLYGLEWWFFALFAVFLWWRWARDELARGRSGATADDVSPVSDAAQGGRPSEPAPIRSGP